MPFFFVGLKSMIDVQAHEWFSRFKLWSFEHGCSTFAAADAHGNDYIFALAVFHCVSCLCGQYRSGCA
jgi:hypothetical protein